MRWGTISRGRVCGRESSGGRVCEISGSGIGIGLGIRFGIGLGIGFGIGSGSGIAMLSGRGRGSCGRLLCGNLAVPFASEAMSGGLFGAFAV